MENSRTALEDRPNGDPPRALNNPITIPALKATRAFLFLGLASTLWFLIRVIPKPIRASYPCMQAAAPLMSSFIVYLLGVTGTIVAFTSARRKAARARYGAALAFGVIALCAMASSLTSDERPVYADSRLRLGPNTPIGVPRGVLPGRVVWAWNPQATNENCTNAIGDGWFPPTNTNVDVVNAMVREAMIKLTGRTTGAESWDILFRYFNQCHGRGIVGYMAGEKIFIRTNQVSASTGTYDTETFEIKNQSRYGMAETSPQVVLAILRQLVNECGVKQANISVGDPMKHMYKHVFEMWQYEFPGVVHIDSDSRLGRTAPIADLLPAIYYSDHGAVLKSEFTAGNPYGSYPQPRYNDSLSAAGAWRREAQGV
jgi:hypothetical protein